MVNILKFGSGSDKIHILLERLNKSANRGIDSEKYSGTIRLKEDPLHIQKKIRDERE